MKSSMASFFSRDAVSDNAQHVPLPDSTANLPDVFPVKSKAIAFSASIFAADFQIHTIVK